MWSLCHCCVLAEGATENKSGFKKGVGRDTVCPLLAEEPPAQVASTVPKLLNIFVLFSYSIHEDLCLRMLGLVDFLLNWLWRFCSSHGFKFLCCLLLVRLGDRLSPYRGCCILLIWDPYCQDSCVHAQVGTGFLC